jgi:hypothetical protein
VCSSYYERNASWRKRERERQRERERNFPLRKFEVREGIRKSFLEKVAFKLSI